MVEGFLNERSDHSDWLRLGLEISEGVEDLHYTLRHTTHNEIANIYIRQQLKEAKEAPDPDAS